jgi:hypothetical protein
VEADDLGEASVEGDDPVTGERFVALSSLIDRRFDDLQSLATQQERQLAAEADAIWEKSAADIEAARAVPKGGATDDRLDPFHDHIDEAASVLADLHSLNGNQVADEISSLRRREQASYWPASPPSSSARPSRCSWAGGWAAQSPYPCGR